jgi:hypothetical protein
MAVIRTSRPIAGQAPPEGAELGDDGRTLRAPVGQGAANLPALTRFAADYGGGIDDISMHGARLQDVFITLTGRDLRE